MGQKINPISLRLQQTNRFFDSCWYSDNFYTELVCRDIKMQMYLNSILKQLNYPTARLFIQNIPKKLKINLFYLDPRKSRKEKSKFFNLPYIQKNPASKALLLNKHLVADVQSKSRSFNKKVSFLSKGKNISFKPKVTYKISENKAFYLKLNAKNYFKYFKAHNFQNWQQTTFSVFLLKKNTLHSNPKFIWYELWHCIQFYLRIILLVGKLNNNHKFFSSSVGTQSKISSLSSLSSYGQGRRQESFSLKSYLLHKLSLYQWLIQKNKIKFSSVYVNSFFLGHQKNKKFEWNHFPSEKKNFLSSFKQNSKLFFKQENSLKKNIIVGTVPTSEKKSFPFNTKKNLSIILKIINKSFNNSVLWRKRNVLNLLLRPQILNILNKKKNYLSFTNTIKKVTLNNNSFSTNLALQSSSLSSLSVGRQGRRFLPTDDKESYKQKKYIKKRFFLVKNNPFKQHLESIISNQISCNVSTLFYRLLEEKQSALFLAEDIVYYLEKRKTFSQIKNYFLKQIERKNFPLFIQGIRISCSGRLGGKSKKAQRAKTQTFKYGPTSLHVFSSNIDFAYKYANTAFGKIGVKVWICFN